MAIGSTVVDSVPTVGSTVNTLAKVKSGSYSVDIESGTIDVPLRLTLRASDVSSLSRRFGATYKFTPSILDAGDAVTRGRISVSLTVDASLGSTITRTALLAYTRQAMGALLQSGLLEALVDGSLE